MSRIDRNEARRRRQAQALEIVQRIARKPKPRAPRQPRPQDPCPEFAPVEVIPRISEVYFLYACNRIKIGMSRNHIHRALNEISPYCPAPLFFIGATPGDRTVEAELHDRFSASRVHGEWFTLGTGLREFLCEDQTRTQRLMAAEEDYLDWLEDEIATQRMKTS